MIFSISPNRFAIFLLRLFYMRYSVSFFSPPPYVLAMQICLAFEALAKYFPSWHVFSVHVALNVSVEYVPGAHGAQCASAADVPAFTPSPAGQVGLHVTRHPGATNSRGTTPVVLLHTGL